MSGGAAAAAAAAGGDSLRTLNLDALLVVGRTYWEDTEGGKLLPNIENLQAVVGKTDESERELTEVFILGAARKNDLDAEIELMRSEIRSEVTDELCAKRGSSKKSSTQKKDIAGDAPPDEDEEFCPEPLNRSQLTTGLADVIGQDRAKQRVSESFISPRWFPGLFKVGARGLLLYGPPGSGKTLMARGIARDIAGVVLFAPTPGQLKGKYHGQTERRIAELFKCAEKYVNDTDGVDSAIIFIDEIEGIAGDRGTHGEGMTLSVNALLQAMDGISTSPTVSVIGATNYPGTLDSAILRRFSSRVMMSLPDLRTRLTIIANYLAKHFGVTFPANAIRPGKGTDDAWRKDVIRKLGKILETVINVESAAVQATSLSATIMSSARTPWCALTEDDSKKAAFGLDRRYPPENFSEFIRLRYTSERYGEVSPNFLILFAEIIGIQEAAVNRVDEQETEEDAMEVLAGYDSAHIYGFSASDVTKIMDHVVNRAAARAKGGIFVRKSSAGASASAGTAEYIFLGPWNNYVANLRAAGKSARAAMEDVGTLYSNLTGTDLFKIPRRMGGAMSATDPLDDKLHIPVGGRFIEVRDIPEKDYGSIANTTLCALDFVEALSEFSSTINNQEFWKIRQYSLSN